MHDGFEIHQGEGPLVERFVADLRACDFGGRSLDVRENVKYRGGHFTRWVRFRACSRCCPPLRSVDRSIWIRGRVRKLSYPGGARVL